MDYRYIPFYMQGSQFSGMYYNQWGISGDKDIDYIKEMYPATFTKIQELVDQEINRQEFVGSMLFDEYPDKMGVYRMVKNVFDKLKEDEKNCNNEEDCIKFPDDNWLKDIIMVLILNEMYRCRQKRKKYFTI